MASEPVILNVTLAAKMHLSPMMQNNKRKFRWDISSFNRLGWTFYIIWFAGPLMPERFNLHHTLGWMFYCGYAANLYFGIRCIIVAYGDDLVMPNERLQKIIALTVVSCLLPATRLFSGVAAFNPGSHAFEMMMAGVAATSIALMTTAYILVWRTPSRGLTD